ncbi:MAG: hypothetical protein KA371_00805 [Acidobacteria bacterium]|nr:hypothetical protein [Acidobacteriota bacterium]
MRALVFPVLLTAISTTQVIPVAAQPLGQFRWQQQPYCNVVTLSVVQDGAGFHLDGWDDQCGAPTRAAAVGLAVQNPDGTIGFGVTLVTTPGGTPVHVDATISLPGLNGTWRDSTGHTGAWTFLTGGGLGGSPRPVAQTAFPAGLSAGNARVTDVGAPTSANDAANRAYVDGREAAVRAALTAPLNLSALTAHDEVGTFGHRGFGCLESTAPGAASVIMELPLPIGARLLGVHGKYTDDAPADFTFRLIKVNFWNSLRSEASASSISTAALPGTGFVTIPLFGSAALNTVRNDQTFYVRVSTPSHAGGPALYFCGVQVEYTMP